ncbi:MAG: SulP family inorganic anion transporter [Limisphaerales bacterium]
MPLAMALAIASGLKPEIGIFTAIIGGFLVSLLGGSRVQIGGPAGAFVPLLAPIVILHGPEALVVCAMMAGVILIVLRCDQNGIAHQIYSLSRRDRFHERHCDHHLEHANPRLLRAERKIAAGFHRQAAFARRKFSTELGDGYSSRRWRRWRSGSGREKSGGMCRAQSRL